MQITHMQILGEHNNLYGNVFENFRNTCLKIYKDDHANFFSPPGLAWQAAFEKTKVKLDLLTDIDTLLIVEKVTRGDIYLTLFIDVMHRGL